MAKMAIVGCEASGKTVFMAALTDYYRPDAKSNQLLCLAPENSAANRFAALQRRTMRSLHQWPAATNPGKTTEMNWSLRLNGRILERIGMLEFGGETFRAAFREAEGEPAHKQAVKDLMEYLTDADFVVVLVSIKELLRDPGVISMEEFERDTESIWVTRGLLEFVRERLPATGIVIGLTQSDRYRTELAEAGGAAKMFASRWPTIRAIAPDIPVVEVASVSRTDENGNPAEGYLTDGVLPVMKELARQNYGEAEDLLKRINDLRSEIDSFDARKKLSGFTSRIKKLAADIEKLTAVNAINGSEYNEQIKEAVSALEKYQELAKTLRKFAPKRKRHTRPLIGRKALITIFILAAITGVIQYLPFCLPPETVANWIEAKKWIVKSPESVPTATSEKQEEKTTESAIESEPAATPEPAKDTAEKPVPDTKPVTVIPNEEDITAQKTETEEPKAAEKVRSPEQIKFDDRLERAKGGDIKCKRWIAHQYYSGSPVAQRDTRLARKFYEEAAEGGDAIAMYYLAIMCANGDGGIRNANEAHYWFLKAKKAGCDKDDLDELIRRTAQKRNVSESPAACDNPR